GTDDQAHGRALELHELDRIERVAADRHRDLGLGPAGYLPRILRFVINGMAANRTERTGIEALVVVRLVVRQNEHLDVVLRCVEAQPSRTAIQRPREMERLRLP